jgi:O-antigen ligase
MADSSPLSAARAALDLLRPPSRASLGFWLFALHLLTLFGLAGSNVFLGLMILYCLFHFRKLRFDREHVAPIFVPATILALLYVASTYFSLDKAVSDAELKDLLSYATLFLAPVLVRGEAQVRALNRWLVIATCAFALHGLIQFLSADFGGLHNRIIGPFSHYQTFSGVLLIGLLIIAARGVAGAEGVRWRAYAHWTALFLVLATLLSTLTRGAWVAAALTLSGLILLRARRLLPVALGVVIFLALFVIFLAPRSWMERFGSIASLEDVSNYDRLCMIDAGLYMISERPLLGIGPEVVEERYPIYRHGSAPRQNVPHLHNTFLMRAAEQGLPALLVYLWLMVNVLRVAWAGYRRGGSTSDLYLAVILIVIAFNIAGFFEDNWRDTEVRRWLLYFMALPLCLDAAKNGTKTPKETPGKEEHAGTAP